MWCIMGRGSALDIAALRPSTRPVSSASYTSAVPPRPIFLLHDVCKAKLQSCCTYYSQLTVAFVHSLVAPCRIVRG